MTQRTGLMEPSRGQVANRLPLRLFPHSWNSRAPLHTGYSQQRLTDGARMHRILVPEIATRSRDWRGPWNSNRRKS